MSMTQDLRSAEVPVSTCIVVACYEEKGLHGAYFVGFTQKNSNISFLFVNDGSTEKTL